MTFSSLVQLSIGAILINNLVLSRFLGLCPFLGVSKKMSSAVGMGLAVIFVMTLASMFTWIIDKSLLMPNGLVFMRTIVFILVIAGIVQLVEMTMRKLSPLLYESLGIYLPLIATNCAVLGVALIVAQNNPSTGKPFGFIECLVNSVASGAGFLLALVLMAGIRERIEFAHVPKALQGLPIAFIAAGLIALAFLGFSGLDFFASAGG